MGGKEGETGADTEVGGGVGNRSGLSPRDPIPKNKGAGRGRRRRQCGEAKNTRRVREVIGRDGRARYGVPMRDLQRIGVWGFVITGALVAVVTLSPHRVDAGHGQEILRFLELLHRHGVPAWFGYRKLEFTANIALVVPLGFFLGLALPAERRWTGYFLLPILSAAIELTQKVLLPERVASVSDVAANSLGAWTGLTVAVVVHALRQRRASRGVGDSGGGDGWGSGEGVGGSDGWPGGRIGSGGFDGRTAGSGV